MSAVCFKQLFYTKDLRTFRRILGKTVSQNHEKNYRAPVGYKEFLRVSYVISTNRVFVSVLDSKVKTPTIGLEFLIRGR